MTKVPDETPTEVAAVLELQPAPLPASLTQRIPFTPESYRETGGRFPLDAPVYLYRTASRREQIEFNHDLMSAAGMGVTDEATREQLREAATALLPEDVCGQMLNLLDRWAEIDAADDPKRKKAADELADIMDVVNAFHRRAAREHAPYRRLVADRGRWAHVRRLMALERFLIARTTIGDREYAQLVPYELRNGRLTDEAMDTIAPGDFEAVGDFAVMLTVLRLTQKKS